MTKRRTRGDGSVYRRNDGRYMGEYDDANGKRRYVSGMSKADVRAKLRKALADKESRYCVSGEPQRRSFHGPLTRDGQGYG